MIETITVNLGEIYNAICLGVMLLSILIIILLVITRRLGRIIQLLPQPALAPYNKDTSAADLSP